MMVLSGEQNQDAWLTFDMGSFTDFTVTTLYSLGNHKYLVDVNTPSNATNDLTLTVTATDNGTPAATTMRQYTLTFEPSVVGMKYNKNKEITIFPNPAKESFIINNLTEETVVSISDLSGRTIKQVKSLNATLVVNTSDLNEGIYLVHIQSSTQNIFTKVIVNK
jgi:hypothetical protein